MDIRELTNEVSVTGQINPQDVAKIASLGFRSIICNRHDQEEMAQPSHEEIAAEAEKHGLPLRYLPVRTGMVNDADADTFGALVTELPKPILAYCRSGTRCTVLWSLSEASKLRSTDDILTRTLKAGYDMHGIVPRLQSRRGD